MKWDFDWLWTFFLLGAAFWSAWKGQTVEVAIYIVGSGVIGAIGRGHRSATSSSADQGGQD